MANTESVKPFRIILAIAFAVLVYVFQFPISDKAHIVMAITAFTGFLWFTEALPLHVTALLSTLLVIQFASVSAKDAFGQYFAPTIVLFFGGFMIARAMEKHGLDKQLGHHFISSFGRDPNKFLLGLMAITAFISLWISNTAAAAIMLPMAMIAIKGINAKKGKSNFAKAAVLGIAFAATIGGIGTVVGTPPNGITVADLAQAGITVTFFDWAYYGMPFVVIFLPLSWFILIKVFKPEINKIAIADNDGKWTKEHKMIITLGFLTIIAWVTSSIHGVADASVAIISVVVFYALSLLETDDVSKIEWSALLLFGGGLALGSAIDSSGLGTYLGSLLGGLVVGQSLFVVFAMVGLFAVLMTLSASNTATAALIVPLVIPVAKILGVSLKPLAIVAGMGTSLDFLFPVGTPPSAIAFSTGYISVKDMFKAGVLITISGIILLAFLAWLYW